MKKLKALILAAAMLVSAVSCSNGNPTSETSAPTADTDMLYLKEADITMSEDFKTILLLDKLGENVLIFGTDTNDGYMGYVTDKSFADYRKFVFTPKENEVVKSACLCKFGKTAVVTLLDNELMLYVFNTDGDVCNEYNLGEHEFDTEMTAVITANGEDYIINLNNESLLAVAADGTIQGEIDCKGGNILGFSKDNADVPVVILGYGDATETAQINGTSLENKKKCSDMSSSVITACAGIGEYSIAAVFYDAMYGLKGNEWVKLCDFTENDFAAYEVAGLIMTAENSFIVSVNGVERAALKRMDQRDYSEKETAQIVKIATVVPDAELSHYVSQYNSANDKYKIEIVNYGQSQDREENINALKMDIVSGNAPDIMPFNGDMPIDTFGAKESIFVDLYSMIDNDPDLSREDFVDGFLEGMESNGKLLMITPSFIIKTIECKDKFLNGLTSWNFDQMMESYNKISDNIDLTVDSKYGSPTSAFYELINYNSFIDYDKGICDFDNETFIKLLKFFKDNNLGSDNSSGWDSDMIRDHYKNDVLMLKLTEVSNFLELYAMERECFNEPATIIGYPTENGSVSYVEIDNGYSILANSDVKDGAWDFIKYSFFSDSYYSGTKGRYTFPAIDRYIDEQMEDFNKLISEEQNEGESFPPMSDEESKEYKAWVRESAKNVVKLDNNVIRILWDELNAYFNDERSAEETAKMIQNRVSLYVSERYS